MFPPRNMSPKQKLLLATRPETNKQTNKLLQQNDLTNNIIGSCSLEELNRSEKCK